MATESDTEYLIHLGQQIDFAIGTEARVQLQAQTQGDTADLRLPDTNPHTFKEMFASSESDTILQRLLKWYMMPRGNPRTTIRVLETLQAHQFQKLPKVLARFGNREQSTYTIKDSRLSSLIDYGANQSVRNEVVHIGAIAATNIPFGVYHIISADITGLAIQGGCTLLNLACIFAQKYSRARCEIIIDKSLARGRTIDYYEYNNRLNLRLPNK